MSASGSDVRWFSLLEEKTQDFVRTDVARQTNNHLYEIKDVRSFRSRFETFCRRQGEHRYPRLEARLLPTYQPIIDLAQAVGKSATDLRHLSSKDSLEALIWRISFALLEYGFRSGIPFRPLVELVAELNKTVPRFSADIGTQFPSLKKVQKPLQDVYRVFVSSNLSTIEHWKNTDCVQLPADDDVLMDLITETSRQLEKARGLYDVMVNQAIEDEKRRKADEEQMSFDAQHSLPDVLHLDRPSNREAHARFISIRTLGRGSFGTVEEVRELSTGVSYARKHIHLDSDKLSEMIEKEVKNEVAIMQKLRHLHIATVLFHLKEEYSYSIFMLPVADCDLRKFLNRCSREDFPPRLTKLIYPWFGCLLNALAYAHKLEIKHRDIKPSNILIKNNQPYLSDFGLAKDFARWDESTSRGDKVHGTPVYRAPEVIPDGKRGRKADVFSLGCVYTEMFTVCQGRSLEEFRDARLEAGSVAFRDCLSTVESWLHSFEGSRLNDLLVDQILSMVERNPDMRPSAEQAENYLKCERALFCVE